MKNFEKWFAEEPTEKEKGFCMVSWRAALKWMSDRAGRLNNSTVGLDIATLRDAIEEELEEVEQ